MENYKQIAKDGETEIVIKGSRFICALQRVETQEEAMAFIQSKKKEHYKATHNCSAFLIGYNDNIQRANDDGEPNGTAGVPMLEVLKKNNLHFIVAVVTRYFGGTKLGAGGLIRAYSSSVSYALKQLGIVMHTQENIYDITISYNNIGKLDNFLSQNNYRLLETFYTENTTYRVGVIAKDAKIFIDEIIELFHNNVQPSLISTHYIDLPIETDSVDLNDNLFND